MKSANELITQKSYIPKYVKNLNVEHKWILVTGHRRENFGAPIREIFEAIEHIIQIYPDVEIIFPVHYNPNVRSAIDHLRNKERIHLLDPISYQDMVWFMQNSHIIITDSGGIQEEAPYFGTPVLVTRNVTERQEGVEVGTSILVGTSKKKILSEIKKLLNNKEYYNNFSKIHNPYGDGNSSKRIADIILQSI